jgi:3-oxoacyl-[acyl-carrier protein] reductase
MRYNEIEVGMVKELTHKLTQDDIKRFVELTGDDNRLHTDIEYASKTSFKKPVAHGMLGASFISTIIGTKIPGDGALWFSQSLEFLLPVRVGDSLTIIAEVVKKDDRNCIIELKTDVVNQNKQKVIQGFAKVKVIEQEKSNQISVEESLIDKKIALVIGASGGIGSAVCKALANAGFDIGIHYYSNLTLAENLLSEVLTTGRKAFLFKADITVSNEVKEMVSDVLNRMGTITALINCTTSKIPTIKLADLQWVDFEVHINNQINGTFNLVKNIVPIMEKNGYGKIITINSQALDNPSADWLPYITAKGALMGFTRALAFELAPKGIRVNSVSPGMTDTDLVSDVPDRVKLVIAAKTPLRRLATTEDIARSVVFLASENSDFLCGETIRVNGGQIMI